MKNVAEKKYLWVLRFVDYEFSIVYYLYVCYNLTSLLVNSSGHFPHYSYHNRFFFSFFSFLEREERGSSVVKSNYLNTHKNLARNNGI